MAENTGLNVLKKYLFVCFVLLAISQAVFAGVEISLNPGFAAPGMEKFNAFLSRLQSYRAFWGLPDNNKTGNAEYGLYANLDFLFVIIPGIKIGARAGYVYCFRASVENYNTGLNSSAISTYDAYLIPLMPGMTLSVPVPKTNFTITAGGFGGYGIAGLTETQNNKLLGFPGSGSVSYMSGGFTGDVFMGFGYRLAGFFSLGANVGYRTALITSFIAGADSTNTNQLNIKKGSEFRDPDGVSVPLDYSGLNADLSLKFEF